MRRFQGWLKFAKRLTILVPAISVWVICGSSRAAEGHWRVTGYTISPEQSELVTFDRLERQRGRVSERRVSGAYQAADSGAGTVEIFFKNDDADRRVYITTMTFSFTTGVEMRSLYAGQKLGFNSTLAIGGNDMSRALPASATGTVWVNNGDYIINLSSGINEQVSGSGSFEVPRGSGNGDTLVIKANGHIGAYGGLNASLHANYVWVSGAPPVLTTPPSVNPATGPSVSVDPKQWMTGTFDTSEGILTLSPKSGTYTQDNGRIHVTSIAGATMEGYWEEDSSARRCSDGRYYGRIRWTFTQSGFSGTWGYCDDEPGGGGWSGTRR